jgi:hypothetical protein
MPFILGVAFFLVISCIIGSQVESENLNVLKFWERDHFLIADEGIGQVQYLWVATLATGMISAQRRQRSFPNGILERENIKKFITIKRYIVIAI